MITNYTEAFIETLAAHLRERLAHIIGTAGNTDWLLFSGGVDSSILAAILSQLQGEVKAVTVTLESSGEDIHYARELGRRLGLHHYHVPVTVQEAIHAMPAVIRFLKSFDPAIPNDIVVYFAMMYCKAHGGNTVMTGDGADEIFAGYDFMREMPGEDAARYIQSIAPRMFFSSNIIADSFDFKVIQPFIDRELIAFALEIPMALKIRREEGREFGKWALRRAFEDILPRETAWQDKRPLEYGSGMTRLRETITSMVSDEEYDNQPYPVTFMNKEHYYYYKVYREVVGDIPEPAPGEKACIACGAGMRTDGFHCRICGNVLNWRNV